MGCWKHSTPLRKDALRALAELAQWDGTAIPNPLYYVHQTQELMPHIANETQARKELARLKSIALNLHTWKAEAQAQGNETWVKVYGQRLSGIRADIKYIARYLATCPA